MRQDPIFRAGSVCVCVCVRVCVCVCVCVFQLFSPPFFRFKFKMVFWLKMRLTLFQREQTNQDYVHVLAARATVLTVSKLTSVNVARTRRLARKVVSSATSQQRLL